MTSSMILFIFCLFFLGSWHLDTISDTRKSSKQNSQIEIIKIYIIFTFQSSFHCSPLFSFPTLLVLLQVIPGSIYILDFIFFEILIFQIFSVRMGLATPHLSAHLREGQQMGDVLQGSECAVSLSPPRVAPSSPTTSATSGTRATPAPTPPPPPAPAPSPSTRASLMCVN